MIDWHSHILPAVDDGSRTPEESVQMLDALKADGVDTVIATPHFTANRETLDDFLKRREDALEKIRDAADLRDVKIIRGAEVKYYPGISRMEGLDRLTIEGTRLLLLEMPMTKWTDFTVRELMELSNIGELRIIMAHIERYIGFANGKAIENLCDSGALMQVNASFFERIGSRRRALKMLESGYIHLVGSDCHNMTSRPPRLSSAYGLIQKKLGDDFVGQMIEYGYRTLNRRV